MIKLNLRDDRGIALIASLGVAMVVSLLTIATVSFSAHNLHRSATNRERVQSIAAAEAGLNRMFAHLEKAGTADLQCSMSETLSTDAESSFTATLHVQSGPNLVPLSCPPANIPAQLVIRSVGEGIGDVPTRTMEATVNLTPNPLTMFGPGAIFSDRDLTFNSNIQLNGAQGDDGNIYSNGTVVVDSNSTISGSVFAQNEIHLDSNTDVKNDAWAKNRLTMDGTSQVRGSITSSTSSITMDNSAHVYGDAKAGTTITLNNSATVDGTESPNSPSAAPPSRPFPDYTYDAAAWQALGYSVRTESSCSAAKTFINTITSGAWVVRITSSCNLSWGSNSNVLVKGKLAIVHEGNISLDSNTRFTAVNGPHDLHFIAGLGRGGGCKFEMKSNVRIGSGLNTLFYVPQVCDAIINSNSFVATGQIFAGQVFLDSNASFTYRPMPGPAANPPGQQVDPLYSREIINT